MFRWKFHKIFSFFILDETGNEISVSNWEKLQLEYFSQLSILNELWENGFAEHTLTTCEVEANEILNLSEIDKQILYLPNNYPYEIYIQSDGQLNQNSFKFKYGFYDFTPNGNRFVVKRNGAIIDIDNRTYLLSANQLMICEALEQFNSLSEEERTFQNNLKCFADIKTLSKTAASYLDSYLQSQNVYHPDKIKVELEFNKGVLEIIPTIDIENPTGFTNVFDNFQKIKDVYPVTDGEGGTTRIIIDERQKEELKKIKDNRRIIDCKVIEEIVEHPESFFDDEKIDLSVFYSNRVKEIGIYKPKFYPFVCPYKSEWIPGIAIKDKIDGEKRIHFKSSVELGEFETEKWVAEKSSRKSFEWRGIDVPIEVAANFIQIAKKQFANPKEPVQKGKKVNNEDEVLIIKENAELTEYSEDKKQPTAINHNFTQIRNLSSIIDLKLHQIEGIAWLQTLQKEDVGGCLLADDMGLGKTLQVLYFIEWHSQFSKDPKPYLIVAPVTLLENWENEYQKFFLPQNLPLTLLYGDTTMNQNYSRVEVEQLQRKQIILTNYETLRAYQFNLCAVDYAVVVLDEAQKIKTPGTLVTNVSKALKADFKIAMTGTPVENTLVDLWCIMDFSVPGLLGNAKDFAKEFQNPLKEKETDVKELGIKLRNKIGIFIKRRYKKDVLNDLPNKIEHKPKMVMPDFQLERYKVEIEQAKNAGLTGSDRRNQILKSLWAIRDISDHPLLVDSQISNYKTDELISSSAKLKKVVDILTEIKSLNEKVILFADRKETQKMLQKVIFDYFNIFPSIVNGDTPSTRKLKEGKEITKLSRQQTIDRFQGEDGFNVIIMSQLAAGVGLNVTKANHVIHYTRHWNPAKEEQATDRAYRIGQQKDVHVYYPMAVFPDEMKNEDGSKQKSFDEILDALLNRKKSLATETLFPSEQAEVQPGEIFDNVFGLDTESKPIPLLMKQVDRLTPDLFEAFVAALYTKQGFQVYLTPYSNDKGADVVAMKEGDNYLLQAKQTKSLVGNEAIQEIYTAKNYYEEKFSEKFKLIVISNSNFSSSAETLSRTNQVDLIKRIQLENLVSQNDVTIQAVYKHESQRLKKI